MTIQEIYKHYCQHYLVDTDTRSIRKNSIYIALKGANFNGNEFAQEALDKGASLSIVDEEQFADGETIICVDDALATLQELARYHRKQLSIPVIGLTGSNGKTTSKELISAVLSRKFNTFATRGNLNNHIGVPLSILSIRPEHEMAIIEMGANHQKEIEFLSSISNPDFGFITNFGKAHMEGFGGVEGIIKGKSELYQNIRVNKNKVFVNAEDPKQMELTADLDRVLFHPSEIKIVSENPFLVLNYQDIEFKTHLIGSYNTLNIAIAFALGKYFQVPLQKAKEAIADYIPSNNRSQYIETDKNTIHLDAYNANPSSMKLALESFAKLETEQKMVVLGDMFELGADSLKEHQAIQDLCVELGLKDTYLVGSHFYEVDTAFSQFKTYQEFENAFKNLELEGCTLLIKGSRGMALERILDHIK